MIACATVMLPLLLLQWSLMVQSQPAYRSGANMAGHPHAATGGGWTHTNQYSNPGPNNYYSPPGPTGNGPNYNPGPNNPGPNNYPNSNYQSGQNNYPNPNQQFGQNNYPNSNYQPGLNNYPNSNYYRERPEPSQQCFNLRGSSDKGPNFACEGEWLQLHCSGAGAWHPHGNMVIVVLSAMFGRRPGMSCRCADRPIFLHRTDCQKDATHLIRQHCEGQSFCNVKVDRSAFHAKEYGLCPEVRKYAEVDFKCVPREEFEIRLSCSQTCRNDPLASITKNGPPMTKTQIPAAGRVTANVVPTHSGAVANRPSSRSSSASQKTSVGSPAAPLPYGTANQPSAGTGTGKAASNSVPTSHNVQLNNRERQLWARIRAAMATATRTSQNAQTLSPQEQLSRARILALARAKMNAG